jgi:hypothetical protein
MEKVSEYLTHAEDCRRLATFTSNVEHKAALIKMAETWEGLSRERAERLKRQQRIAALDQD